MLSDCYRIEGFLEVLARVRRTGAGRGGQFGPVVAEEGQAAAGTVLAAFDRAYRIAGSKSPSHCDRGQRGVPRGGSGSFRLSIGRILPCECRLHQRRTR